MTPRCCRSTPRHAVGYWRAHAKAGDPWAITGYLGKRDDFDEAMGKFALAYADQAERDHAALKAAVRTGVIEAQPER
jgi:Uncharacterized protein conserved in bacteria (DUF2252)